MIHYREIVRMNAMGYSIRAIASSVSSSRNTVSKILEQAEKKDLQWPLEEALNDHAIKELLFPSKGHHEVQKAPDFDWVHNELSKPSVTLSLLWHEYELKCRQNQDVPYSYRQFCRMYQKHAHTTKTTMKLKHKPGEKLEVDWAGKHALIQDPISGQNEKAFVFVAVLPYSQLAYVEAFLSMESKHWIQAHIHAFEYMRGVPRTVIPDNLKTGVVKAASTDPVIHQTYQELAEHYHTVILPARVRRPKDKPSAEGSVSIVSTWIVAALRNQTFFTIEELNQAIQIKLSEYNQKPFQKKEGSRQSIFENEETHVLLPLPSARYEMATWKTVTVPYDYHVLVDNMYYSVPYEYVKHEMEIRSTQSIIECFFKSLRVASHARLTGKPGQISTHSEHMPEDHRNYLGWDMDYYTEWAQKIGPSVALTVSAFFKKYQSEKQAIKACRALVKLSDRYTSTRLNSACESVLAITNTPSIETIKTVLKNLQSESAVKKNTSNTNSHSFTRGAAYFGRDK